MDSAPGGVPGFITNVIRKSGPIKGTTHSIDDLWLTLLEKLVRRGAMLGRGGDVRFDPSDLGLEGFDALVKLVDGHRVEVLASQCDQWVVGLAREEVFQVHAGIVDPRGRSVNKRSSWERASLPS